MLFIYPYKTGSLSVSYLKELLGAKIIRVKHSRYIYRTAHTIINWGNSRRPSWMSTDVPVINKPEAVDVASNKLLTLEKLNYQGVRTVPFTKDKSVAEDWAYDGVKVYARHTLTGHSGEGIEVVSGHVNAGKMLAVQEAQRLLDGVGMEKEADDLDNIYNSLAEIVPVVPTAPLYTYGIENHGEYRVHVFNGEVILYQKKSRRVDEDGEVITAEGEESDVRNLASNWVYRTGNLKRLERIERLAIDAVSALGLDFGAVDIIKDEDGDTYVLEVNTAPGLGNTETLQAYATAINKLSQ